MSFAASIMTLDQVQAEHVRNVLEALDGNITATARALNVDRRTLYRMCERWKIDVSEYREGRSEDDDIIGLGNPLARSHPSEPPPDVSEGEIYADENGHDEFGKPL